MDIKLADGRTVTIQYIVDHPDEFGYRWSTENLERPKGTVITRNAQIPIIVDLNKSLLWYDAQRWLAMSNKSSVRVQVQNPQRDYIYENKHVANDTAFLKTFAIETMLGVRSKAPRVTIVEKPVYTYGGVGYETQLEALQAELADKVTMLLNLGLSAEEANDAARKTMADKLEAAQKA